MMRARLLLAATLTLGIAACIDFTAPPSAPRLDANRASFSETPAPSHLLVCPTSQSQQTTGIVGLLGGLLSLGNTSISLPFAAVLLPQQFEVDIPQSDYMEVDIHAVGLTSFLFHS